MKSLKKYISDLPELMKEWDWDNNNQVGLNPFEITYGSNKKVLWICPKGHSWPASPKARYNGQNCSICSGRHIVPGINDLATLHPEIAKEWFQEKNGELMPNKIAPNSHTVVWWKCKNGHEWPASPNHRVSKGRGCRYCCHNPSVLSGVNDLETLFPDIAKEWNSEKNKGKKPSQFTAFSNEQVYWKCKYGHEWPTTIEHRTLDKSGCPICQKALQTSFPEQVIFFYIKKIYHDAINGYTEIFNNHGMELDIYIPEIKIGIEYDGEAFHKTKSHLERERLKYNICKSQGINLIRIRENRSNTDSTTSDFLCYACDKIEDTVKQLSLFIHPIENIDIDIERDANEIKSLYLFVSEEESLAAKFPNLVEEWDFKENGSLKPEMYLPGSNDTVAWICSKGHKWPAQIYARSHGSKCPYCTNRYVMPGFNDLQTKRPDLMEEWDYEANSEIGLNPSMMLPGSGKKAYWKCKYGHKSYVEISSRNKGHGCRECWVNRKRMKTK